MAGIAEYDDYDALGLAALVRSGEVAPAELLEAAVARVEARDPGLNAVTVPFYEFAERAIAAGLPEGPFTGVPFLLKDLGAACAGTPLTFGSRLYEGFVCAADSTMTARYKRAGLVVFGRTNSPELGLSYATEPALYGPTRNPWDRGRTPGGSSGGAAAAVAARMVPAAHASDGGGSIRVPASCCGLFGLKPTRGRSPTGPDSGEAWAGMAVGHVLTRSVRDSAALLDVIAGPEPGDPYWAPPPARPFLDEVGADPGRLRVAVAPRPPSDVPVHADCRAALERAAALCAELGHEVAEAEPALDREAVDHERVKIIVAHLRADLAARAAELGIASAEPLVEPMTRALASLIGDLDAAEYVAARDALHRIGRQLGRFFLDYDVLMTPTLAQPPLAIGVLDPTGDDVAAYMDAIAGFAAFPALANVAGVPAMSVPLHWTGAGLPIGVQVVAPLGDEATLFRLAAQLEEAAPWAGRRPEAA